MDGKILLKYINRLLISLIILFFIAPENFSFDNRVWINPGVKIGYQFGADNGFIFGLELSTVFENNDNFIGILVDLDFCKKAHLTKLNVAFEIHPFPLEHFPLGISVGPSLIFQNSDFFYGFTGVVYSPLFILVPCLGSTYIINHSPLFEAGSYFKIPVQISGRKIKF